MEIIYTFISQFFTNLYGISALGVLCLSIYWLFDKKAKKKNLAKIRARLDELSPTDPEYNKVRELYISMMINDQFRSLSNTSDILSYSGDGGDSNADGSDSD